MKWQAGKIRTLRPAFRALRLPAAFVYEALEHAKPAPTSFELAEQRQLTRSTVHQALQFLAAFDLVQQRGGCWHVLATTSLMVLAEILGCVEVILARLEVHRAERAAYRRALRIVAPLNTGHTPQRRVNGPPPDRETVLRLLKRNLRARRIA